MNRERLPQQYREAVVKEERLQPYRVREVVVESLYRVAVVRLQQMNQPVTSRRDDEVFGQEELMEYEKIDSS